MAQVKFIATDAVSFGALTAKDAGTLYFLSDTKQIYKGDVLYGGGIYKAVDAFPATDSAERNTLYIHKTTGEVKFFDGTALVTVVKPYTSTISGAGNGNLVTSKAVVDYLADQINNLNTGALADRVTAVEKKASDNATAIGTINGTGAGSIKKAASDAQTAAIAAAATDATTKANAAQKAAETTAANALSEAKKALQTSIDAKATKATTLAGYGIADAYTKDETITAINSAVANAHHLKREIVDQLPAVASANADTIYMVPKAKGVAGNAAGNTYNEYMLINGAFEQIGDSTVDLSDYSTTEQVKGLISTAKGEAATDATNKADAAKTAAITAAATDATTKANEALSDAKSYADGLAGNYATAAQGKKADSALQAADVVEGTTNGAISVKGTAVKVHGLGSAAYTASGAYATAAQGTKADSALQANDIATGTANGTISVKGSDVAVKGLGSAAYQNVSFFDKAGDAASALTNAKAYTDTEVGKAKTAAATDASTKANNALAAAKTYTDNALTWGTL